MTLFTEPERFYTLDEIADLLRINKGTLYQQRWRGEPPGSLGFRLGARVLFSASEIEKFLEECRADQRAR